MMPPIRAPKRLFLATATPTAAPVAPPITAPWLCLLPGRFSQPTVPTSKAAAVTNGIHLLNLRINILRSSLSIRQPRIPNHGVITHQTDRRVTAGFFRIFSIFATDKSVSSCLWNLVMETRKGILDFESFPALAQLEKFI